MPATALATAPAEVAGRMTADEFFAWDGGGHIGKLELVHGVVRAQSYASGGHGTIQSNLARRIANHLDARRVGCRVGTEVGVIPTFDRKHNVRKPDLTVTCTPHVPGERAFPKPILIVEVLSPSNATDTWESIQACSTIGSVIEILIVDSERRHAQVFRRQADGLWPTEPEECAGDGTIRVACFDLALPLAEIYAGLSID